MDREVLLARWLPHVVSWLVIIVVAAIFWGSTGEKLDNAIAINARQDAAIEGLRDAVNAIRLDNAGLKGDIKSILVDTANIARAIDRIERKTVEEP